MTASPLSAQDRWDIQQTLSLYDHVVDNAEWDRLADVLTADARLETPDGAFESPDGARRYEETAHPAERPSHHVLNTVLRPGETPGTAVAWSRFVLIGYDATVAGGDYVDTLVHDDGTWRISVRRVRERNRTRAADDAYTTAGAVDFAGWLEAR